MILPPWAAVAWKVTAANWRPILFSTAFVLFWYYACDRPHGLPAKEQTTHDSLSATRPAFVVKHDTVERLVTKVLTKIVRDSAPLSQLAAKADTLKHVSDSLAIMAGVASDTASQWHGVAVARQHELDLARLRIDTLSGDLADARGALRSALTQLSADTARTHSLETFAARLEKDVKRRPSRKRWFIGGAIVGAVASNPKARRWISDHAKALIP